MSKEPEQIGSDIDKFLKDRGTLRLHVNSIFQGIGLSAGEEERIKDFVVDVWEKAGSDLCDCLGFLESILVVEDSCCRREARVPLLPYERAVDPAQIILVGVLKKTAREIKIAIAHETAHFVLLDWQMRNRNIQNKVGYLTEARADGLARKWGFPLPTAGLDPDKPGEISEKIKGGD